MSIYFNFTFCLCERMYDGEWECKFTTIIGAGAVAATDGGLKLNIHEYIQFQQWKWWWLFVLFVPVHSSITFNSLSSFYVGDNNIDCSDQKLTAFWHVNSFTSSTCIEFG